MKVPTVEGIHLLYLEINKIFSLSCQPICNSAIKLASSQGKYKGRVHKLKGTVANRDLSR
ncbi:hypothetical protein AhaeAN59_17640 (plasmid) [Acinetobacter haemolyticus]|uniref:Uncharacterized protein n=1 Tax=Acinetobacter haemolyticus TaxID=29430 RepID=A0A857IYQ8_ACIHA|nr:hypothetical protein F8B18_18990 [Acinetobacter baumannii]QBR79112.1 hypothetical protein E4K03_18415 [Acinetobacter baumannii]QHI11856.1 hypothetical protein AhaeAN59_17640 [Acinetobacter haemolyticus]QHI15120.1 hypothetical protein AhaeAN43_17530 [Acinetobacter haemolyticus]QHI18421.1 hypothetical protein AhaeAN4_17900 [Acinetobacter haemolyticus]